MPYYLTLAAVSQPRLLRCADIPILLSAFCFLLSAFRFQNPTLSSWALGLTAVFSRGVASLITERVALIESHLAMPIERLRAFASDLKERQTTVKGDRYARK